MTEQRFPFRFTKRYRLAAMPLAIHPRTAFVRVDEHELVVRFGPWSLRTTPANVAACERTGGFGFLKTAGPPHLSFADRGITFATNADDALCLRFHEPVAVLDPTGSLLRHPGATLTVADPEGLARALGHRIGDAVRPDPEGSTRGR